MSDLSDLKKTAAIIRSRSARLRHQAKLLEDKARKYELEYVRLKNEANTTKAKKRLGKGSVL